MEISYLGNTGYRIKSKSGVVVINPGSEKSTADIAITTDRNGEVGGVKGTSRRKEPFVISEPGEYEVESISIFGYGSSSKNTIYVVQTDDLRVAHLGKLESEFDKKLLDKLKGVDVLMIPVSDAGIEDKKLVELVGEIEPVYIVPMGSKDESKKIIELLGKTVNEVDSLSINKATLPIDLSEVVVFE